MKPFISTSRQSPTTGIAAAARRPRSVVAVAFSLVVVSACTESDRPSQPDADDFSTSFSARSALAEIPRTDCGPGMQVEVTAYDLAKTTELAGVDVDTLGLDNGVALLTTQFELAAGQTPDEFETLLGWNRDDIAATISFQDERESFDLCRFDVFRLDSDLSAPAERAGDDSIVDVDAGEGLDEPYFIPSTMTVVASPALMGVDSRRSTVAIADSKPALSTWLGDEPSILDDPVFDQFAESLDRTGVIYAFELMIEDFSLSPSRASRLEESPELFTYGLEDLISEPFSALGIGWSGIGETQRTAIVYVFETDQAAAASVEPIEQLWAPDADFVDGDSPEGVTPTMDSVFQVEQVSATGQTVTVVGRAAEGATLTGLFNGRTNPRPTQIHR